MKKSLLLLLAVMCWGMCAAIEQPDSVKQKKEKVKKEKKEKVKKEEKIPGEIWVDSVRIRRPYFAQGDYNAFIQKHTQYPTTLRYPLPEGRVDLICEIGIDGTVSVTEVLMSPHPELTKAVTNTIKKAPKWYPLLRNGEPVKIKLRVVVNFKSSPLY